MKYNLPKLIEVIDSKNPNWTEKRIDGFIDSICDKTDENYNALTRADRKVISGLSNSNLRAYVGSLVGEQILDNARKSAVKIRAETNMNIEQLLNEANVEAQQIRDDAHTEGREYLSDLNAVRVVELYAKDLPTEGTLMSMPKVGILDYAQLIGCDVNDEMSKQEIVDTISNSYDGLEREVIVVPDKSEQSKYLNQQKKRLGILENDLDSRERQITKSEELLNDLEGKLKDDRQAFENEINSEENEHKRIKLLRFAQGVVAGTAIAMAGVYGEYTGITDWFDLTHLRG